MRLSRVLCKNEDKLDERMAEYRCDRRILLSLADRKSIQEKKVEQKKISIDATNRKALAEYKNAVMSKDLNKLVARYPMKESRVFEVVAKALECRDQDVYRSMVIARIKKDAELMACLKRKLGGLSEKLDAADTSQSN